MSDEKRYLNPLFVCDNCGAPVLGSVAVTMDKCPRCGRGTAWALNTTGAHWQDPVGWVPAGYLVTTCEKEL